MMTRNYNTPKTLNIGMELGDKAINKTVQLCDHSAVHGSDPLKTS